MVDAFCGEIRMFGGAYAPVNFAFCDGSQLLISQYEVLYTLIGTAYGGSGTKFALPDLRGRIAVGQGTGPGLTPRTLAQTGGTETVTLTSAQLPSHNHSFNATSANANLEKPQGAALATLPTTHVMYLPVANAASRPTMDVNSLPNEGGNQAHNNVMPTLFLSYIIAVQGLFPSQS